MVMSAPMEMYGQEWMTLGGSAGSGSNDMSKGRALGSNGRYSIGSVLNLEVGNR